MQQQLINPESTSVNSYLGNTISKSQLAKKLGVTRNTLLKFHNDYALEFIEDYYNSFPEIEGVIQDELPMTDYQAWVLSRLVQRYLKVPTLLIKIELSREEVLESFDSISFNRLKSLK